jgi:hypothetical protein
MKIFGFATFLAVVFWLALSPVVMADAPEDFTTMNEAQLQKAAQSSAIAQRILARRMLGLDDSGENVSKIIESKQMQVAIDLLRKASISDAVAANTLGILMRNGIAKQQSEGELLALFKFAADRGLEGGIVNLAIQKLFANNSTEAASGRQVLSNFIQNSKSDWTFVALRSLSTAMIYGIGGEQDIARGIEGYELFLQFDPQDARVLTLLGKAKQYGWAGERDIPAAIAFYERAIEGGSTSAMWELGMLLKDGDGVEADAKKAWDLIVRASDAGDENAMISRAVLLALGEGVPQNYGQAYAWYEKAASNGRAHAIRSLAFMNQQGQDREVDPQLAWGLYTLAEPFDEIAKIRLAEMQVVVNELEESKRKEFLAEAQTKAKTWLAAHNLSREDLR